MNPIVSLENVLNTWFGYEDGTEMPAFVKAYANNWYLGINSGAIEMQHAGWIYARSILVLTAESYLFNNMPEQKKQIKNLRYFI